MATASPVPNPETLDLIFEHVRDLPERQFQDVVDMDAKFVQAFAAASVVIGAAALVNAANHPQVTTVLLVAALLCYGAMAVVSFLHLRPIGMHGSRYGDTLWDDFKDDSPADIKLGIVLQVKDDYGFNSDKIKDKARTLNIGLILTGVEAVLVASAVIVSRLGA